MLSALKGVIDRLTKNYITASQKSQEIFSVNYPFFLLRTPIIPHLQAIVKHFICIFFEKKCRFRLTFVMKTGIMYT